MKKKIVLLTFVVLLSLIGVNVYYSYSVRLFCLCIIGLVGNFGVMLWQWNISLVTCRVIYAGILIGGGILMWALVSLSYMGYTTLKISSEGTAIAIVIFMPLAGIITGVRVYNRRYENVDSKC